MAGGDDSEEPTPEFYSEGAPDAARDISSAGRVRPGTLLLASTDLLEPTFARTVIYVMEHNDAGSLGVVLNRTSQTAVHNLLPQWSDLSASPRALFIGGPVKQDAALCLGVVKLGADISGYEAIRPLNGRVALVDLDGDPEVLSEVLVGVRVFAGYSGWGIGQLDGELEQNSWMLASALATDLLVPPTADLWADVLRRQPWPMPLLASHPIDVTRN
ncbi:YqgE/AlgH family protein [Gordonia sp. DT218]|uniref:YqgE/AlgH family protein n=1 Tax=unclassified Gordonia (in: high G+C Gram-positive bacteria) TaxID=2657482 RepID=UPI003CF83101